MRESTHLSGGKGCTLPPPTSHTGDYWARRPRWVKSFGVSAKWIGGKTSRGNERVSAGGTSSYNFNQLGHIYFDGFSTKSESERWRRSKIEICLRFDTTSKNNVNTGFCKSLNTLLFFDVCKILSEVLRPPCLSNESPMFLLFDHLRMII